MKIEDICVRDRKVFGILYQMSGAEDSSGGLYALAMVLEAMGT